MQLLYDISIPDDSRAVFFYRSVYESLWSAGGGRWDYLTEENAEAAINLPCELIGEIVRLRNSMLAVLRQP